MKKGLEVTIDAAGNIIEKEKAKNPSLKPIAGEAAKNAHKDTDNLSR
jgi:hypothetical protein